MTNPKHTVEFVDSGATLEVSETETILQACLEAGIASGRASRVRRKSSPETSFNPRHEGLPPRRRIPTR